MQYKFKNIGWDNSRNCVARAISLATDIPYKQICSTLDILGQLEGTEGATSRHIRRSHSTKGVYPETTRKYLESLDWELIDVPKGMLMDLLPHKGTIIIKFTRHIVTAIDGIIYDTWDCRKTKGITGFFQK